MPIKVTTATVITLSHVRTRLFLVDLQTSLAVDDIVGNPENTLSPIAYPDAIKRARSLTALASNTLADMRPPA